MTELDVSSKKILQPTLQLFYWSAAWGISILATCIAAKFFQLPKLAFIAALVLNIGIGVGVLRAHMQWLKALDEMQRKIQLEAMGLTLGILWIAFGALLIVNATGIAHINAEVFPVLAALVMSAGTILGLARHK